MRTNKILSKGLLMSFFSMVIIILLFIHMVVGLWFLFLFPSIGWKLTVVILPVLLTALLVISMMYTRTHFDGFATFLYHLAYSWGGLVFIFFFLVIALALVQTVLGALHINARHVLILVTLAAMAVITAASIYGGRRQPRIKYVDVEIAGAPALKAAVLSDSHLGIGVSVNRFKQAMDRLQQENPDILLVLGDVFEYGKDAKAYADILADFKTPLGTYGVFGNHEYIANYDRSSEFFKMANIRRLANETVLLPNGIELVGIDDIRMGRISAKDLEHILQKTASDKPRILLSHQPSLEPVAAENGVNLMLSGHTHNGQIFPFNLFVRLQHRHVYGLFEIDGMKLYVTSGMFYWGTPLRFLTASETPVIRINS